MPWDQALDIILQTRGLDMRKNGNVVWIAPRDELATKEKLALEAQQQISDLEPLRTETFQLNYTKAAELAVLLRGGAPIGGGGGSTSRSSPSAAAPWSIPAPTRCSCRTSPSRLEEVRKLIATIDIPVRQVMIEARIVEANDTFSRNARRAARLPQPGPAPRLFGRAEAQLPSLGGRLAPTPAFHTSGQVDHASRTS